MLLKLLISFFLVGLCVATHASCITLLFQRFGRSADLAGPGFWAPTWCLIRIAGWLVVLHIFEISLWALLYVVGQVMPEVPSALYFSSVTYTTVGYGDLVLPEKWRLVGGIEALTGILMCGWSTGFFFTVVNRMHQTWPNGKAGN